MSTASWTIDRETAEIIMPNGRESFDMDRAWPRNGAVYSANQYEWCHVFDGGIECAKCGILRAKEAEGEEYDLRKVPTGDGGWGLEFCTYEFTELMHCDCGETLGGWEEDCSYCHRTCNNYDYNSLDHSANLGGYVWDGILYSFDDVPTSDMSHLQPICEECLFSRFESHFFDEGDPALEGMIGDGTPWKLTPKGKFEADVAVRIEFDVIVTANGDTEREILNRARFRLSQLDFDELVRYISNRPHGMLRGYGVNQSSEIVGGPRETGEGN